MADNTLQAETMVFLKANLDILYAETPDVFVAMDLLWYPVEGRPEIRVAPDLFLVFGRPKGYRGSYKQFEEANIAPQVVFEILSSGNRFGEMLRKLDFYNQYSAEEYYLYNPETFDLTIWYRPSPTSELALVEWEESWTSPRTGIRFDAPGDKEWALTDPKGGPFRSPIEIQRTLNATQEQLADVKAERDRLIAQLRAAGIEPE